MADRHLNLFYTYNRDNELVENNLTRAFIVFLSIVSGTVRNKILSTILKRAHKTAGNPANSEHLDFTNASFALQSNIDRHLPEDSDTKLLLTVSTEPLVVASSVPVTDTESDDEGETGSDFSSVPDAWVYDEIRGYCILIEAKVGSYPLSVDQLQAHARDWFRTSLGNLDSCGSLCSITWIDVLETLRDVADSDYSVPPSERALLSHMRSFVSYHGYRLFEGFDFGGLHAPPDSIIRTLPSSERRPLDLGLQQLASPPDFVFMYRSSVLRQGRTR